MRNYKRLGKAMVCLLVCAACLICASPVSALSMIFVPNNAPMLPELPVDYLEEPSVSNQGHRVSYVYLGASYSTVIGCLEEGTQISVLGTKKSYYKIDCYDMNGYIPKDQVSVDEAGNYYVCAKDGSRSTAFLPAFSTQDALQMRSDVVALSKKYIGVPYVWGGETPKGFDCSGFTKYIFRKSGLTMNRTALMQLSNGVIIAKEDMQPGDLVFFSNTDGPAFASHIGMYLGNGKMIHSGASRGVCIVDLDSRYFTTYYQCSRRVILSDMSLSASLPTMMRLIDDDGSDIFTS
jgi:hypothetical protein